MTKDEYIRAAEYWSAKEASAHKMNEAELSDKIGAFLSKHNTCALATGGGADIRCTPLEYSWRNGALYIMSEGGLKFKGLAENNCVSVSVFEPYSGFGKLSSLQITGTAVIIEPVSAEYADFLAFKKIPAAALAKLDHTMYLIKIVPSRFDMLCSDFKAAGYDVRQSLLR